MAVTIIPLGLGSGNGQRIIRDADTDETAEVNVNDGAATIYALTIDNTANGAKSFVKFWDAADTVVVGTTAPNVIIMMPASVSRTFVFKTGLTLGTGLSFAAVTTAGTAGTTGPTSAVIMNVVVQ